MLAKHRVKYMPCVRNRTKRSHTSAKLHLLPFYDVKVVSIISLVDDMLINFDCPFKHGIKDLRKLFLHRRHTKRKDGFYVCWQKMTMLISVCDYTVEVRVSDCSPYSSKILKAA